MVFLSVAEFFLHHTTPVEAGYKPSARRADEGRTRFAAWSARRWFLTSTGIRPVGQSSRTEFQRGESSDALTSVASYAGKAHSDISNILMERTTRMGMTELVSSSISSDQSSSVHSNPKLHPETSDRFTSS